MAAERTTITFDESLAESARELGVNVSAAACQGAADAVRAALLRSDREAYQDHPEHADPFWSGAEVCGER